MIRRLGIHARIFLSAFTMIAIGTLALDVAGVHIISQFMHKRFEDRIAFLAKYLALNSEVGLLIGDAAGLKSLALNLLGEEDVARVEIMDNQQNVLVDLSRKVNGPISSVETPVLFKRVVDENMMIFSERATPFGKRPVAGEEHIGKVRIHFSTYGIKQLIRSITQQFFWISCLLTVLTAVVFYFLSRSITMEVNHLAVTAKQVARGDYTLRAKEGKLPETKQLSTAFNGMLDSLMASRQALQEVNREMIQQKALAEVGKFSLMVAHEVKNPLAIIKSSMDILKKDFRVPGDNLMVQYIGDEISRLNRLIESFLQFAKPTKPKQRRIDLNDVISDVIQRFEMVNASNTGRSIGLHLCDAASFTLADPDLLSRAFGNILQNALEAAGTDGSVSVTTSSEAESETWKVTVEDSGPGIDPENIHRIFEPFFTTRSKGTGLGLAFAAQVIKSHGGFVLADNRENGGAVFTVELPLRSAAAAEGEREGDIEHRTLNVE